jgi:hypothetical protein
MNTPLPKACVHRLFLIIRSCLIIIVIAHCNVGGNPTCESGNEIGRGDERIRGCVLESTRTRDGAMAMAGKGADDGENE